ncbi:MAG TPA: hypothetical protein VM012_06395 [Flavitalea sp.]|nr:hypothetical protein [Flavitalea sp.]
MQRLRQGRYRIVLGFLLSLSLYAQAQTEMDGIMMSKENFCSGIVYSHNTWKEYWEGTFKRDNKNIGTVSTNMFAFMGNYGITDKLNALIGVAYVETKASAGTLKGMKGMQDMSLSLKWMPIDLKIAKGELSFYGVAGVSLPVSDYVVDFLPMSIGLGTKNLTLRIISDYQLGKFFATGSGAYILRSNVKIDRISYYTTEMHYSNEVRMPDAMNLNFRAGYRSNALIAEVTLDQWKTLGGFDIRKNDMPFPSNEMNATKAGIGLKYTVNKAPGLSLIGGATHTLSGRNVGQSTTLYGGAFYVIGFSKKNKNKSDNQKTNK